MTSVRAILHRLSPAEWVLAGLVLPGTALRILALVARWPVTTSLADSSSYAGHAHEDLLGDPAHPAGYATFLRILGVITHQVAVVTVLQHLMGIATALVLYAAIARLARSPWPGLLPAAVVLLNSDQIFLEQSVMSETLFGIFAASALYAAVRAIDAPVPWWRWPLATGVLTALAAIVRTEGVFLVPVVCIVLLVIRPRPWKGRLAAPVAALASAAVLLLAYAVANDVANGRFEIGPSTGWHLYGRVAPFVDCNQFTPPKGTGGLCHPNPPGGRAAGNDWYIYLPDAPARRLFGPMGNHDGKLKAFAIQVIEHQPLTYARAVFRDVKTFFVPDTRHNPPFYAGPDLSTELDWNRTLDPTRQTQLVRAIGRFFDRFKVDASPGSVDFLQSYEHPFRFGATLLTLCSLLTLLGLLVGDRRLRTGVFLFGVGALAMLALSMFGAWYVGRYTVPVAAPVAAGASLALYSLWSMESARRRAAFIR
jgi:4-amino-4-deoxy-L-arabinose transferase-like glycosyltransferase